MSIGKLKWFVILCGSIAAIGLCAGLGLLHRLWAGDPTFISFGIIALYLVVTLYVGYLFSRPEQAWKHRKACGFASDLMERLGFLGTVIGFAMAFGDGLGGLDGSPAGMKAALATMVLGLSTALFTTLVGLVCSMQLDAQLELLDLELGRA